MIILDENITDDQRQLLRSWNIAARKYNSCDYLSVNRGVQQKEVGRSLPSICRHQVS